jgi:hypothetical protein
VIKFWGKFLQKIEHTYWNRQKHLNGSILTNLRKSHFHKKFLRWFKPAFWFSIQALFRPWICFSHHWKGELTVFFNTLQELVARSDLPSYAARGHFGAASSDHCKFSWWGFSQAIDGPITPHNAGNLCHPQGIFSTFIGEQRRFFWIVNSRASSANIFENSGFLKIFLLETLSHLILYMRFDIAFAMVLYASRLTYLYVSWAHSLHIVSLTGQQELQQHCSDRGRCQFRRPEIVQFHRVEKGKNLIGTDRLLCRKITS